MVWRFLSVDTVILGGSQNFRSVQGGVVLPATRKSYVLTFPGLSSQGDTKQKHPTKNMLSN